MVVEMVLSGPVEPWSIGETAFGRTEDARPETYDAKDEWIAVGVEGVDDEGAEATQANCVLEAGTVDG